MPLSNILYGLVVGIVILVAAILLGGVLWPLARRKRRRTKDPRGDVDPARRYDAQAYLTTHNSFSNYADDYTYAQQSMAMTDQLNLGARGLMLDTHWCGPKGRKRATLAHAGCRADQAMRLPRSILRRARSFEEGMAEIAAWLRANPAEVVTIFLEDYVVKAPEFVPEGGSKSEGRARGAAALDAVLRPHAGMIYAPEDRQRDGHEWPLVGDMVRRGKRLVVFGDTAATELSFYTWRHVDEGQYSTVEFPQFCKERAESAREGALAPPRTLVLANLFPELPVGGLRGGLRQFFRVFSERRAANSNSAANVARLIECTAARTGRPVVNFVAVDFAEKGAAEEVLREKNRT